MKKMLKACALMLVLAVALCALPASATVIFLEGSVENIYPNWLTYDGEKVYIFDYNGNYVTWSKADGLSEVFTLDKADFAETEEGINITIGGIIPSDDGIYAMVYVYGSEYDEEEDYYSNWLEDAILIKLAPNADGMLSFSDERVEMEWDDMVESYDDTEYARDLQMPFISEGRLIFSTYTDNGMGMGVYEVESGEGEVADVEGSMETMCRYKDGALIMSRDYDNIDNPAVLHYFDPETLETEEVGEIPTAEYNNPTALAYDEDTDTLYFSLNGCLWSMPGLDAEAAVEVSAVSTGSWSNFPAIITKDGDYVSGDYSTIAACSTDPSDRPESSMTVYTGYNSYMDDAYYAFTSANSDIEVVKAVSYGDITQAMMNRDSSVDIYVLSVADNGYKAVFERGYMAELGGSEKITSLVNSMYPALQNVAVKDSVVYGVPVSVYTGGGMSYDPLAFEKLGLTEDDVPTTMMELMELFQRLPELMEGNDEVSVFQPYMTQQDARYSLFYYFFEMYGQCMQAGIVERQYDTELMRSLLEAFEKIDFAALGLSEEYDEDVEWVSEDEHRILFESYFDLTSQRYVMDSPWKPLLLSFGEDMDPIINANVDVAFINPFTENMDLAVEFMEMTVDSFKQNFLNEICPDQNVPVKNEYYEENLQYYEDEIASMKAEMEKAQDDETKEMWQTQIEEMEKWRDEYTEKYAWDVTEESLAYYRQYAAYLKPSFSLGLEGDASDTYYDQIWQYIEGNITYDEMLRNIDDKLKMMLMEDM